MRWNRGDWIIVVLAVLVLVTALGGFDPVHSYLEGYGIGERLGINLIFAAAIAFVGLRVWWGNRRHR